MKSDPDILNALNGVLTTELTSINHYFLHARMFRNWGFEKLNKAEYKKSIQDMKQADNLIERILMLEGLPNLQKLMPLNIGENSTEMLACDLKFQQTGIQQLKDAVALCESKHDYVSRNLLTDIQSYEEDFLDWLESQHDQQHLMGTENYLQAQLEEE